MKAVVTEIQVCGGMLFDNLRDACFEYVSSVDNEKTDRWKLNFHIVLPDKQVKHITIRQWGDEIVAYGDFEGLPDVIDFAKEVENG